MSQPPAAPKKISSALIVAVALILLIAAVVFDRQDKAQQAVKEESEGTAIEEAIIEVEKAKLRQIENAMLNGKAVSGMTKYQVIKSMGSPESFEKTSSITDANRRAALHDLHAFEILHYYGKDTMVLVDTSGEVVWVSNYTK